MYKCANRFSSLVRKHSNLTLPFPGFDDPSIFFYEHVKIIYYMYLPILVIALKKKGRCCMNLQIFWRILHYPWGEVLFKIFSYQTETVTSVSDLLRADITQRLCKGNASDSAWTGYQSITENFIKWNRSRKTWQARNHPFITVCQLLSYVDFMISPSYPPSQQINHIPRGTLMGGNWHTVCTFKKKINTKVYHKIYPAWFKVWSLP